jgi:hypothetical protein
VEGQLKLTSWKSRVDFRNYPSHQVLHVFRALEADVQDLLVVGRFFGLWVLDDQVADQREPNHPHSTMPGHNDLRNSGHAWSLRQIRSKTGPSKLPSHLTNCVSADLVQHAGFRASLEVRSAHHAVHSFLCEIGEA